MAEFQLPETLDGLASAELQALIDAGLDALRGLAIGPDSPEDTIVEGERIVTALRTVQARIADDAASADRRARADALNQVLSDTPTEPEPEGDPEPPVEEPEQPEEAVVVTPDEVLEPVAAAASPARRAAANAAPTPIPARRTEAVALIAAADVPGYPTGATLDGMAEVTAAVLARSRGLPTTRIGGPDGVRHRYGAAMIRKQGYGDLTQVANGDDYGLVWAAADERRLPGNSLVAAGGWCAPSETLYDLCQYETVDGILSIPEFQVTRGGIRWTPGPSFADIYNACGFELTEAQAIAGTANKACCQVDCPDFDEIRLDAVGLCVKTPLLTNQAYPELTRRFMEGALVAHQHKVNKRVIGDIAAAAGTPTVLTDNGSLEQTVAALEIMALGMRYSYRMSQTQSIEVVAPFWLLTLIRMDIARRTFVNPAEVTDAQVNGWFTARNMAPQWVYDWQDLTFPATGAACAPIIPATADVLMYPAGTWAKGSADVINVDSVYDSTGLADNVFTALFMEEGILTVQKCTHTCAYTVPICITGNTGAADLTNCFAFPVPPTGP